MKECFLISKSIEGAVVYDKKLIFWIVFMLYVSLESFLFGISSISIATKFTLYSYLLLGVYSLIKLFQNKRNDRNWLISLFILLMLSALVNGDFSGGVYLQLSVIIIGCYVANNYDLREFLLCYDKVLVFIALSSIIVYFTYLLYPSVFNPFPRFYDFKDNENIFLGISNILDLGILTRNMSFFREPGVYIIFLLVGLIINLFCYEIKKPFRIVLYVIAMLTSLSTAGYVLMLAILWVYFFKANRIRCIVFTIVLIAFAGVLYGLLKDYEVFIRTLGKFDSDNQYHGSTISRSASFFVPLRIALDSPLLGAGLNGFTEGFLHYSKLIYHETIDPSGESTNTFMNMAATYGLPFFFIITIMLYSFCRKIVKGRSILAVIVFTALFLALSNEDLRYSLLWSTMLFFGVKRDSINNKHIRI